MELEVKPIRNSQFAITFCDGDFTPTQNVLPVEAGDLNPQSSLKILSCQPQSIRDLEQLLCSMLADKIIQ